MPFFKFGGTGGVVPGDGAQTIVEVTADYQVLPGDDIINCDGTFNVTLPDAVDAIKEVTITSTNGTITILADVAIEQPSTLTTGASETFYLAQNMWNHK